MIDIDDDGVQNFLPATNGLVLLRLTADYCAPCKSFTPVLETLEQETGIPVYNLDIDKNPITPRDNGIMGIPTVLVYFDGVVQNKLVGAKPLALLKQQLEPWTEVVADPNELRI